MTLAMRNGNGNFLAIGQFYFCLSLSVALELILFIYISHFPFRPVNVVQSNKRECEWRK